MNHIKDTISISLCPTDTSAMPKLVKTSSIVKALLCMICVDKRTRFFSLVSSPCPREPRRLFTILNSFDPDACEKIAAEVTDEPSRAYGAPGCLFLAMLRLWYAKVCLNQSTVFHVHKKTAIWNIGCPKRVKTCGLRTFVVTRSKT